MASKSTLSTAPKTYEVINWLLSSDSELPERFKEHRIKLNQVVPYVAEQLWYIPKLTSYINKHFNNLYNIPDSLESLVVLKKLFINYGITKRDLRQSPFIKQPRLIEAIESENGYDEGNARSKSIMIQMLDKEFVVKKATVTKAIVKKESRADIKELASELLKTKHIKEKEELEKLKEPSSSGHYLLELNQDIIDKEELILFDISLLEKTNRVLFIFIDKHNHKKYWVEPFHAKIFVSKEPGVINNDYIEDIRPEKFTGYIINDFKLYNKLKYILGSNYKKVINDVCN